MRLPFEASLPLAGIIREALRSRQREQPSTSLGEPELAHISYCAALCEVVLANRSDATPLRQLANGAFRGRSADLLSFEIRSRFGFDRVEPLFDLVDRSLSHGCVIVGSPANVSVAVVFGTLNVIFIAPSSDTTPLYEAAYCLGHTLTLAPGESPLVDIVQATAGSKDALAVFSRRFAGHLLLPPNAIGVALRQIRRVLRLAENGIGDIELFYLSRIFGIPFETAARRCEDESLIPRGGARALVRELQKEAGGVEQREAALALPEAHMLALPLLPPEVIAKGLRDTTVRGCVRDLCLQIGLPEQELERLQSIANE